jgi:hypothetical protein
MHWLSQTQIWARQSRKLIKCSNTWCGIFFCWRDLGSLILNASLNITQFHGHSKYPEMEGLSFVKWPFNELWSPFQILIPN